MMGLRNQLNSPSKRSSLVDGLSEWWELGEAAGTNRIGSVNGTVLSPGNSPVQISGISGNAVRFDGVTQQLTKNVPIPTLTLHQTSYSIALWVRFLGTVPAIAKRFIGRDARWSFKVTDNTSGFEFEYRNLPGPTITSQAFVGLQPITGIWYFLTWTSDPTRVKTNIGVNGVQQEDLLIGTVDDPNDVVFAMGSDSAFTAPVNCDIDQFAVWKGRVLSQADISYLYNAGAGRAYSVL